MRGMRGRIWVAAATISTLAAAARAEDFDARRAKDVAAVVTSNGASGALSVGVDGKTALEAQAARIFFDVYFDDCDTAKALCDTVIFSGSWDTTKLTEDEVNRWNRWTLYCPAYLDAKGEPDIWYSVAVSAHTAKDDVANDVDRWMGCLTDFDTFVAGPDDFLKRNAPVDAAPAAPAPATPPPERGSPPAHTG